MSSSCVQGFAGANRQRYGLRITHDFLRVLHGLDLILALSMPTSRKAMTITLTIKLMIAWQRLD